ncbi:MAG: hypothetical protein IRZ33_00115 [Alicyclobacillaceae bacterium]|nr:hypothetical protein [Alicyclobacillaceae bacterium]
MGSMLRLAFRLLRMAASVYGMWMAVRRSRLLALTGFLYELVRRRRVRDTGRVAQFRVVTAGEPAIYRRRGWRKLGSRADAP